MARRKVVTLTDDLDGKEILSGGETVGFALQGVEYEIDLSARNSEKFARLLLPYIEAGRRVGGRKTTGRDASSTDAAQLAAMRAWAKANGLHVASRGRVSKKVQEAFQAAHS